MDEFDTSPKAKRPRLISAESEKDRKTVEELILDYACKNYMDDVIAALVSQRGHSIFKELNIPHLRILLVVIRSIIFREDVENFDNVLSMLGTAYEETTDLISAKEYVELTTGIKTKVLLKKLFQAKFDYASVCAKLNQYFPKSQLKITGNSRQNSQLNAYQLRYRRLLTRLMLSASEREAYLRNDRNTEFGPTFTANIQQLLKLYCDKINDCLQVPVIEQILSEGPQSQISHDLQDSHSDCMDQLLATCFRGPPDSEQLLAILKTPWEQDNKEEMIISSQSDEDDDSSSASDIFCVLLTPKSREVKTRNTTGHQEPPSMDQNAKHQESYREGSMNCLDARLSRESTSSKSHHHGNQGGPNGPSSRQKSVDPPAATSTSHFETTNSRVEIRQATFASSSQQLSQDSSLTAINDSVSSSTSPNPKQNLNLEKVTMKSKGLNTPKPFLNREHQKTESPLGFCQQKVSSCSVTVSKTRIYLSKRRPHIYWKPMKNLTKDVFGINDTQVSSSSTVESQNSSELSSASVSLLSGPLKHSCNWSAVKKIVNETEQMKELSFSDPFEETYFSEISVYPVERLKDGYAEGANRDDDIQPEAIDETPTNKTSSASESQSPIEQDNTVSSSMINSPSMEPRSDGNKEEIAEVEEVAPQEVVPCGQSTVEAHGDTQPAEMSVAEEVVVNKEQEDSETRLLFETPCHHAEKLLISEVTSARNPIVRLKRLSQDSNVKKYLDSVPSSEELISLDTTKHASDSDDFFVPESDDESDCTSDSSSLPFIELRPDSESQVVRRFPSLNQFCQDEGSSTADSHRVRRCTVQLKRLKPEEINAFTKEK